MGKQWWDGAYNQVTGDYDLGKSMSDTAKKNGKKQGYAVAWDGKDFDSWVEEGQSNKMQSITDKGWYETDQPANQSYRDQQEMLKRAGIDKNEAFHLAHAAGITNVNSKGDIKALIRAKDTSNTSEIERPLSDKDESKKSDKDKSDDKPPETPGKSDEHLAAEDRYNSFFEGDSKPWDMADPVAAYNKSFEDAASAGQEWEAGHYLRALAGAKNEGVSRFIDYLGASNELIAYEQDKAALDSIARVGETDAEPPSFDDPFDLFKKYRDELENSFS